MAIIYSYPKNTDILSTDIVLGTSTKIVNGRRKNITKNFEIGSIATFFNENSSIAIAGQNNFFFQNNIAPGRKAGSISFVPGSGTGTLFNNIVLLRISKVATSGKDVSAYIGTLIDQAIIIAQTDNLNNFGIYKCNNILPVAGNPNFLDLELEAVNANGAITEDFFYAVAVYPGFINPDIDPGSNYTFTSPLVNTAGVVSIGQSSNTTNGYLSSVDWGIFNSKQDALLGTGLVKSVAGTISYITDNSINWDTAYNDRITSLTTTGTGAATLVANVLNIPIPSSATFVSLTTTGDSGSSTLVSGVLNIPTYTLAGLGGISLTSLSSTATGLTYTNTTGVFSLTSGYLIPTTASYNNTNWDSAYTNRITNLTTTGTGAATLIGNVLNIPTPPTATFTSLTTSGSSGLSTLIGGVLNVPGYTLAGLGGVPTSRTLTINGTAYDLTADRTWSVGTITGVTATSPLTSTGGTTPIISTSMATNKLIGRSTVGTGVMEEITIGTGLSLSGGTLSNANNGTVTSVGLTMPTAFTVSNSPITGAGTIAVTGAGTSSQYIRGDGQLATMPSGGGGGSSVNYYLNGSIASSVVGYQQLSNTAIIGAGTDFSLTGNGLITQFLTDVGNPNRIEIPGGAWNFEMWFSMSSNGGTPKFYVELLKYNGTTFTTIANSSAVPETINSGTSIDLYLTSLAVPTTTLLSTDRLAIRVYIVNNSGGRTATLHTEDNHLCEILTTFSGGVTSLNGLTANTQYLAVGTTGTDFNISSVSETHTFNLPTASALNRGALSSADWTTFNSKANASGTTNYVSKFTGATTLGDSQLFDNGTSVLIGTSTPPASNVKFLVYEPSTPTIVAYFQNNNANCYTGYQSSTTTLNAVRIGASGNNLLFSVSSDGSPSERMRIDSAGNVGIGTSSPTQLLHVAGNARVTGSIYDSSNSPGTSGQILSSTVTGTAWVAGGSTPVKLTSQTLAVGSWTLVGAYYTYAFSNINIDTTSDISVTPQNASYLTAYNAQVLPFVGVAAGVATFYSQFPPQNDMVVDIVITQTT